MPSRRINPRVVKLHRSYSVPELAACCGVHKNTVGHWQKVGLMAVDTRRPLLFQGAAVREFLEKRNARRKRPCPPGMLYCFRCREPRPPALAMVDYVPLNATSGNLRAICAICETVMHRRARKTALATILPRCEVQFAQGPARLTGSSSPSLICDSEPKAMTQ